ncbi:hypothetical protein [Streptomyces sp. 3214.6]|uniref:hypothetical protein n=1 Tax=Streptomyces sp. 3214.6 TaxID=1882757 RepID=UPI00090A8F7F|nr:hypothetical protein [Streptomyces sp. 3214.6]SHI27711.1 hypothetical protein SAMN05444521_6739 [Streptomyces sp. 3214.6]
MGIRLLHRRKAHARVHATATADAQLGPGTAAWTRPRPALAPGAATPRVPRTPATALRTAAARLRRRVARVVPERVLRLVPSGERRAPAAGRRRAPHARLDRDTWRLCAEAVCGCLALALSALCRLRRPRTARRIPVVPVPVLAATATPLIERPDGSAPR